MTGALHSIDGGGKQSLLRLADLDVHAFLGDLAGHPWNVNLSDSSSSSRNTDKPGRLPLAQALGSSSTALLEIELQRLMRTWQRQPSR